VKIKNVTSSSARCHCPYHNDKNPSFSVNLRKGVYYCHSCKKSGTLPQLVYELTGKGARHWVGGLDSKKEFDFKQDTPEMLMRMAQMYANEESPVDVIEKYKKMKQPLQEGNTLPWHKAADVRRWMQDRGIPEKTAEDWGFEYAMNVKYTSGYEVEEGEEPSQLNVHRRVIVPLYGPDGNWLSIEARAVNNKSKLKSLYIKPMDFIFRYKELDKTKPVYICEGLVDAARLYAVEPNTTYLFGSSLTEVKKYLLSKFPYVVLIPDNDAPGYKLAREFKQADLNTKFMQVPSHVEDLGDKKMTNSYIRRWFSSTEPIDLSLRDIDVIIYRYETLKTDWEEDAFAY